MKNRTSLYALIGIAVLAAAAIASCSLLTGCAAMGANPTPPTRFEQLLYNTRTNSVTVWKTNEVPTLVWSTNQITLTVTNQQNQTITTVSNIVNQTWHTNEVATPTVQPQYTETVKPSVESGVNIGATILNTVFPGAGSLAAPAITALLVGFGWLRSSKKGSLVGTTLAQEVETAREFIKALPNGAAYDTAFVNFLQSHQNDAGVATQVIGLVENQVSNPDAKAAAQGVIDVINGLKAVTTPIAPVSASPA